MVRASLITFDLYGTLVDWAGSIGRVLTYITGSDVTDEFFKLEFSYVSSLTSYVPYSKVLKDCLRELMRSQGLTYDEDMGEALVLSFSRSPPFPDAIVGLMRIKRAGYRTGVLSNTDLRLAKITLAGFEDLIDYVVTAEDVGIYKPRREFFERSLWRIGANMEEVVHVSSYPNYDLLTCAELGLRTVHLNRYGYEWDPTIKEVGEVLMVLSK